MIYLDAAATTFQKPAAVPAAVQRAFYHMTTPGRGGYREAMQAAETVFRCRTAAAELFGASSEEAVVFTSNATHALNIAIKTLVHPGDTVLVSGYEHNAVMRPLYHIRNVQIRVAAGRLFDPEAVLRDFETQLTPQVDAVICTHVSNVFGFVLPIEQIAALCRARGIPLVIDAAQSAGILPLDLTQTGAAFIAMPGHKGLYGPQGTGILLCAHDAQPLIEGGTGSMSVLKEMPPDLQQRAFTRQLSLAREMGLPVIIHAREATEDTLSILKDFTDVRGVVHCFSGSAETAKILAGWGFYIGFTGILTFKNARHPVEACAVVPKEQLLLETDCPYMAPVPWRGKRSCSPMIQSVAERMAEIKGVSAQEMIDIAAENTRRLFGIGGER